MRADVIGLSVKPPGIDPGIPVAPFCLHHRTPFIAAFLFARNSEKRGRNSAASPQKYMWF
jgi:hypothetical protein